MKKRIRKSVILMIFLLGLTSQYAFAASDELGTLTYWEDNETSTIGRWGSRADIPNAVYIEQYGDDRSFFVLGMSRATQEWNRAFGSNMYISAAAVNSNSRMRYYGGTREELSRRGITIPSNVLGQTIITSGTEGRWRYKSTYKVGERILSVRGYIVDNGATLDAYTNVCMHELGHALGWWGHSSDSTMVMYPSQKEIRTTLSTRDTRHLAKVYK